jgi:hypothetical protein
MKSVHGFISLQKKRRKRKIKNKIKSKNKYINKQINKRPSSCSLNCGTYSSSIHFALCHSECSYLNVQHWRRTLLTQLSILETVTIANMDYFGSSVRLKPDGTRWRMGGEVKGKLANRVCSQYSHTTSELGVSSITTADAHTSAASSRLNWRPRRFKWTCPCRRKKKSGFCACAITFQTQSDCFLWYFRL